MSLWGGAVGPLLQLVNALRQAVTPQVAEYLITIFVGLVLVSVALRAGLLAVESACSTLLEVGRDAARRCRFKHRLKAAWRAVGRATGLYPQRTVTPESPQTPRTALAAPTLPLRIPV